MGIDQEHNITKHLLELKQAIGSFGSRLDAIVVLSNKGDTIQEACRIHCDAEMSHVHKRIDEIKTKVDRLWGVWALAVGVLLLVFKDIIKAVLM